MEETSEYNKYFSPEILETLKNLWNEIGYSNEERDNRLQTMASQIEKVRSDFIDDTLRKCQDLKAKISYIKEKHIKKLQAMGASNEEIESVKDSEVLGSIQDKYDSTLSNYKEFLQIYNQRVDEFKQYYVEIQSYFHRIGITEKEPQFPENTDQNNEALEKTEVIDDITLNDTVKPDETDLNQTHTVDEYKNDENADSQGEFAQIGDTDLTLERLKRFENKSKELKAEVDTRSSIFHQITDKIIKLQTDLAEKAPTEIRNLMNGRVYSNYVCERLTDYSNYLSDLYETRKKYISEMAIEIVKLWDLLDVDDATRKEFLSNHSIFSRKNVQDCINEAERLTQIRDENMPAVIDKMKKQVTDICNELGYTEQQIQEIFDKCENDETCNDIQFDEDEKKEETKTEIQEEKKEEAKKRPKHVYRSQRVIEEYEYVEEEEEDHQNEEENKAEQENEDKDKPTENLAEREIEVASPNENEEQANSNNENEEQTNSNTELQKQEDNHQNIENDENQAHQEEESKEEEQNKEQTQSEVNEVHENVNQEMKENESDNNQEKNEDQQNEINQEETQQNEEMKTNEEEAKAEIHINDEEENYEEVQHIEAEEIQTNEEEEQNPEIQENENTTQIDQSFPVPSFDEENEEEQQEEEQHQEILVEEETQPINYIKIFNNYDFELSKLRRIQLSASPIIELITQREEMINEYNAEMDKVAKLQQQNEPGKKTKRKSLEKNKGERKVTFANTHESILHDKIVRRYKTVLPRVEKKLLISLIMFREDNNGEDFLWKAKPIINELSHIKVTESEIKAQSRQSMSSSRRKSGTRLSEITRSDLDKKKRNTMNPQKARLSTAPTANTNANRNMRKSAISINPNKKL